MPTVLNDLAKLRIVGDLAVENVLDFGDLFYLFYLVLIATDRTVRIADRVIPAADVVALRRGVRSGRGAISAVSTLRSRALFCALWIDVVVMAQL